MNTETQQYVSFLDLLTEVPIDSLIRNPEKFISPEFCELLENDSQRDFAFGKLESLEEHNYFSSVTEDRHDVNVDAKTFKLKAQLLKKKLNERKKLALGFGGNVLSGNEQSASKSKSKDRKDEKKWNEEEITKMLSAKTGLDRGLIPAKIVAVQEYKGILLHLVEWKNKNEEMEAIPSPILSAKYPQVVIEFYQSRAVMCDTFTGKEQALRKS